ncbi:hypothetical protein ACLKA6_015871 [Drosophila palustris]
MRTLLQEQYNKYLIFILKDAKYQELGAMKDYMYRDEVNISQNQFAALLKAAESLKFKGLSDNRSGGGSGTAAPTSSWAANLLWSRQRVREGFSNPSCRRRKVRRRNMENDVHDNSNSSVLQAVAASNQSVFQ